jgi:ankyrin repeat protein/GTPase SAR1 family protein
MDQSKQLGKSSFNLLHNAASLGDVGKVRQILELSKCCVNCTDYYRQTPLHHACFKGHINVVRVLISEFSANMNLKDSAEGSTPLMLAAEAGHADIVHALLCEKEWLQGNRDAKGRTVLHYACAGGNIGLIKTLINKHHYNFQARDDLNGLPIHVAAHYGNAEVVLCLIDEFGCDPNVKGSTGKSLLHEACRGGNVSLVRTLILQYKAEMNVLDDHNSTPLHVAAYNGNAKVVLCLIDQFGCDPNVKGSTGKSLLHEACRGGNVSLVKTLILQYKADINAHDDHNSTALHVAAYSGKVGVVLCLINDFGCDPNDRGYIGRSLLHSASGGGNVSLVRTLILQYKADINARDDQNSTALHVAAYSGKVGVVLCLINDFGCDPNDRGYIGRSLLHSASGGGNVSLVKTLISKFKANAYDRDYQNSTPLHVAAMNGETGVISCLLDVFGCDPNVRGFRGKHLLHEACEGGNVGLVRYLTCKMITDLNVHDGQNFTPLHTAACNGQKEVVSFLIHSFGYDPNLPCHVAACCGNIEMVLYLVNHFKCDPNNRGHRFQSVLHDACEGGNVDLVETLIREHKADITARDALKRTPLHVAAHAGETGVVLFFIDELECDPNDAGNEKKSLLHYACEGGNVNLVKTLIRKYKANVNACDYNESTPLHVAAYSGETEVVSCLVNDFKCDIDIRNKDGNSILHIACLHGHTQLISFLLPSSSLLATNNDGNTPLHCCAIRFKPECVRILLAANAPIIMRNKDGKTPFDVASRSSKVVFMEGYREKPLVNYDTLILHAKEMYSGEHHIVRLFVVGNPGVGKSSLVEALKRESFFKSLRKVSESSVPPHTAGIIPTEYYSRQYGRVLLYDFAGDAEYCSSHAAILEHIATTATGENICLVTVNLMDDISVIQKHIKYWVSFIQQQKFSKKRLSLGIVGSHYDLECKRTASEKLKALKIVLDGCKKGISILGSGFFFINSCNPRSNGIGSLQKQILSRTENSTKYKLSTEANVLLGLMKKDFGRVVACSIQTILSHIKDSGVCLPHEISTLQPLLNELHEIGVFLLLGSCSRGDSLVVMNSSKLTNKVHELLFSQQAMMKMRESAQSSHLKIGVISESDLAEVLPHYITKDCLLQLEYCQEIKHTHFKVFPSLKHSRLILPDQSFFFFPAMCSSDRSDTLWGEDSKFNSGIGWLAQCTGTHDFFPPRFLHVLLLRLVFKFTLSVPSDSLISSPKLHCTMWKTGVQWSMEEGVNCRVEIVNGNKGVVVLTNSIEDNTDNCTNIFRDIIHTVMEAKAEFCHHIKPEFFLLDSTSGEDYLSDDNLFAMNDVNRVLKDSEGKKILFSISRKGSMTVSKILSMRKLTYWEFLFPIKLKAVLKHFRSVHVSKLLLFGLCLGLPVGVIENIDANFQSDVSRRLMEVLKMWMTSSSLGFPCWWHLVEALKDVEKSTLAEEIRHAHGMY